MTITEFLEARIAEDEREANVCLDQYRRGEGGARSRWMRQLAECAAKRVIVTDRRHMDRSADPSEWAMGYSDANYAALNALAAAYKDHPDYRQEWAT